MKPIYWGYLIIMSIILIPLVNWYVDFSEKKNLQIEIISKGHNCDSIMKVEKKSKSIIVECDNKYVYKLKDEKGRWIIEEDSIH